MSAEVKTEQWVEITDLCKEVAAELSDINPMVNIENFSLFDSMSAVELMDPKMDQCFGISCSVKVDDLLQVKIPEDNLPTLALQLFQSLIIYEVAFLDGASLLESTHQCILVWDQSWKDFKPNSNIYEEALFVYSKSLHKSLAYIHNSILNSDVYEDEDFQPLSSPHLQDNLNDDEILNDLQNIMNRLEEDILLKNENEFINKQLILLLQLRYRLHCYYKILHSIIMYSIHGNAERGQFGQLISSISLSSSSSSSVSLIENINIIMNRNELFQLLSLFDTVLLYLNNQQLSDFTVINVNDKIQSIFQTLEFAYNENIVKLMQNNPVRVIRYRSFTKAIEQLKQIFTESLQIYLLNETFSTNLNLNYSTLFHASMNVSYSKMHLLARCLYVSFIGIQCNQRMPELVTRSMIELGIVPVILEQFDPICNKWLSVLHLVCLETLRTLCVNRNRLLSRLDNLLNNWGVIVRESSYIDQQFHADSNGGCRQWLSSWCTCQGTLLMELYLSLAMEMELVHGTELDYYYWYWDYICSSNTWAYQNLRKTRGQYDLDTAADAAAAGGSGKGKKKGGKAKPAAPVQQQAEARRFENPFPAELWMLTRGMVCRGLFRSLVACRQLQTGPRDSYLSDDDNPYMSCSWRFDQRFRAFMHIHNPPLLSYSDFIQTITARAEKDKDKAAAAGQTPTAVPDAVNGADAVSAAVLVRPHMDLAALLENSADCFKKARTYFDAYKLIANSSPAASSTPQAAATTAHLIAKSDPSLLSRTADTSLLKAIVSNSVGVQKLARTVLKPATPPPQVAVCLDRAHHPQFPVPSLTVL